MRSRSQRPHQRLSCLGFKSCKFGYNLLNHSKENVYFKVFGLNLDGFFSNVPLKIRPGSQSKNFSSFLSCPCIRFMWTWVKSADPRSVDNVHLSNYSPKSSSFFNVTKVKVSKTLTAYCHVQILKWCKFG